MWYLLLCYLFDLLNARPVGPSDAPPSTDVLGGGLGALTSWGAYIVLLCLVTSVVFLLGCLCCNRRKAASPAFREFTNSTHSLNQIGFVNPLASSPEVSIFPPPGADQQPHSIISFEPLPTLVPPQHNVKRPPAYSEELVRQLSMQNWFDSSEFQFPRQQLHYVKEIGRGWFGKVVEGEARGLEESTGRTTSKVFVRILKEDASQAEKLFFLHEATPYRRLRHVNILRLMAACLESDPWLLVFESCSRGDLKEFLLSNEASREALLEQGITIKMAIDVATGLSYMIEDGFIHTDVAARNCLVTSELRVKIGDTGSSIDKYPGDYYVHGEVALPVRWCAPESLLCSDTSIQTCTVTEKCNVWSFGVLLWEIFEFGKLPYAELSDDQVITRVFGTEALRLPAPRAVNSHVYSIMEQCWCDPASSRPSMSQVLASLTTILMSPSGTYDNSEFNRKWGLYKPNRTLSDDRDSGLGSGLGSEPRKSMDSFLNMEGGSEVSKSCPSVAKRSLENLTEHSSWLGGLSSSVDLEDQQFITGVSQVIKDLDDVLAGEKTSSSGEDSKETSPVCSTSTMLKSSSPYQDTEADSLSLPFLRNTRPCGGSSILDDNSLLFRTSDTDTEDELWRRRLDRCEFSEKVKEKSKSVADLMILTHIDASSGSSESSLEPPLFSPAGSSSRPRRLVRRASSDSNILDRVQSESDPRDSNASGVLNPLAGRYKRTLEKQDSFSLPYEKVKETPSSAFSTETSSGRSPTTDVNTPSPILQPSETPNRRVEDSNMFSHDPGNHFLDNSASERNRKLDDAKESCHGDNSGYRGDSVGCHGDGVVCQDNSVRCHGDGCEENINGKPINDATGRSKREAPFREDMMGKVQITESRNHINGDSGFKKLDKESTNVPSTKLKDEIEKTISEPVDVIENPVSTPTDEKPISKPVDALENSISETIDVVEKTVTKSIDVREKPTVTEKLLGEPFEVREKELTKSIDLASNQFPDTIDVTQTSISKPIAETKIPANIPNLITETIDVTKTLISKPIDVVQIPTNVPSIAEVNVVPKSDDTVPKIVISESGPVHISDEESCDPTPLYTSNRLSKIRIVNFASSSENEDSDELPEDLDSTIDKFILKSSRCAPEEDSSQVIIGSCDQFSLDFTRPLKTANAFVSNSPVVTSLDEEEEVSANSALEYHNSHLDSHSSGLKFGQFDLEPKLGSDSHEKLGSDVHEDKLPGSESHDDKLLGSDSHDDKLPGSDVHEDKLLACDKNDDDRSYRTTDDERSYKTDDDSRSYKTEDERSYKTEDERSYKTEDERSYKTEDERSYKTEDERSFKEEEHSQLDYKTIVTPDEDRSCDSGFRDKGSLSDNDLSDNNEEMNGMLTLDKLCYDQNGILVNTAEETGEINEEYNLNDIEDGLFQDLLSTSGAKTGWYLHEPPSASTSEDVVFKDAVINKDTLYVEDYEGSSDDEEEWWRDDRKFLLNSEVAEALRKELSDKLPASNKKPEEVEQEDLEQGDIDTRTLYLQYPKILSPILEESETEMEYEEDDQSSLVLNLVPFGKRQADSDTDDYSTEEEDILIVDTQSNEAVMWSPTFERSSLGAAGDRVHEVPYTEESPKVKTAGEKVSPKSPHEVAGCSDANLPPPADSPTSDGSLTPDSLSSPSHSHYTVSLSASEPASLRSYDEKSADVPTLPNFEIYDLSQNSLTLQDDGSSTDQFDFESNGSTPKMSAASQLKSQSCSSETLYNVNFDENVSPQHQAACKVSRDDEKTDPKRSPSECASQSLTPQQEVPTSPHVREPSLPTSPHVKEPSVTSPHVKEPSLPTSPQQEVPVSQSTATPTPHAGKTPPALNIHLKPHCVPATPPPTPSDIITPSKPAQPQEDLPSTLTSFDTILDFVLLEKHPHGFDEDLDLSIISNNLREFTVDEATPKPISPSCIRIFTNLNEGNDLESPNPDGFFSGFPTEDNFDNPLVDEEGEFNSSEKHQGLETPLDDILRRNAIFCDKNISSPLNQKSLGNEVMFTETFDGVTENGVELGTFDAINENAKKGDNVFKELVLEETLEKAKLQDKILAKSLGSEDDLVGTFVESKSVGNIDQVNSNADLLNLQNNTPRPSEEFPNVDNNKLVINLFDTPEVTNSCEPIDSLTSEETLNPFIKTDEDTVTSKSYNPFLKGNSNEILNVSDKMKFKRFNPFDKLTADFADSFDKSVEQNSMMNVTNPFLVESINNAIIKENIRSFDSDSVAAKRSEDQMNNAVQNIDDLISQTSLSFDNTRDENDVNIVLTSSSSHEGDDLLKSLLEVNNGALGSQNNLWPSSLELELSSKYAGEDELGKDSNQLNLIEKTTESKEIFSPISEQKPSKVETNLVTDAKPIFPFENRTNSTSNISNDQPKHKLTEQPSKPSEGIGNTLSDLDTLCTSQSKEKAALGAPKEVTPVEEESQAKSEETQEKSPETQAKSQDSEEKSQETEEKSQETPEKSQETHLPPEISHGPEDSPSKIRRSSLNSQSWPSLQSLDQQGQPSFGDLLSPSSRCSSVDTIISSPVKGRFRNFIVTKVDDKEGNNKFHRDKSGRQRRFDVTDGVKGACDAVTDSVNGACDGVTAMSWDIGSTSPSSSDNESTEFIWTNPNPEEYTLSPCGDPSSGLASTNGLKYSTLESSPDRDSDSEDDDDDDEINEEFVPSSWNCDATPAKSLLKIKKNSEEPKKSVCFKKQRYHCVYEYPREESPHPASRGLHLWNTPSPSSSPFANWGAKSDDSTANNFTSPFSNWGGKSDDPAGSNFTSPFPNWGGKSEASPANDFNFDFIEFSSPGGFLSSDDGEFYISSSLRPFHTDRGGFGAVPSSGQSSSEFYVGDLCSSPGGGKGEHPASFFFDDCDKRCGSSDTGAPFDRAQHESVTSFCSSEDETPSATPTPSTLGELCHTKPTLKLDLASPLTRLNESDGAGPSKMPGKSEFNFLKSTINLDFLKSNAENFDSSVERKHRRRYVESDEEDYEDGEITFFKSGSYAVDLTGQSTALPSGTHSGNEVNLPTLSGTNSGNEVHLTTSESGKNSNDLAAVESLASPLSSASSTCSTKTPRSPKSPSRSPNSIPSSLDIFTRPPHLMNRLGEDTKTNALPSEIKSVDSSSEPNIVDSVRNSAEKKNEVSEMKAEPREQISIRDVFSTEPLVNISEKSDRVLGEVSKESDLLSDPIEKGNLQGSIGCTKSNGDSVSHKLGNTFDELHTELNLKTSLGNSHVESILDSLAPKKSSDLLTSIDHNSVETSESQTNKLREPRVQTTKVTSSSHIENVSNLDQTLPNTVQTNVDFRTNKQLDNISVINKDADTFSHGNLGTVCNGDDLVHYKDKLETDTFEEASEDVLGSKEVYNRSNSVSNVEACVRKDSSDNEEDSIADEDSDKSVNKLNYVTDSLELRRHCSVPETSTA
ncbi:hypothetical protein M8J75_002485 [Diaphorina citri]|nr:hypothetical protein M8J75_002485 [Diaphorina citri]